MKKKVIAAGHICLDITPVFPEKNAASLGDILSPGKLVNVGQADVHTGGSVANTGLAMKFFGADVSLMGKIGNDPFGKIICEMLRTDDAEKGMLISEQESTSYSVVVAVPGIDRIFLHNPGANHTFRAADIPQKALEEAALFHFGYPPRGLGAYSYEGHSLCGYSCAERGGVVLYAGPGKIPPVAGKGAGKGYHGNTGYRKGCKTVSGPLYGAWRENTID